MPHATHPFLTALGDVLPPEGIVTAPDALAPRLVDWRNSYRGEALALVRPSSTEQVAGVVRTARAHGVAVVPQGGNTGLAGGATPLGPRPQVVLTLERMASIRALDRVALTVDVEAGCVVETVKRAADEAGRFLPIAFGAQGSATVGGIISTNAGGVNALRYGTTRQLVLGLEAVLADGSILRGLRGLRKDNAGYDWKQLLIGSEGTLGIVTGALLRLVPRPAERAAAVATVESPARALEILERLFDRLGDPLVAFELMSHASVDKARTQLGMTFPLDAAPWYLLMEIADSAGGASERLERALLDVADAGLLLDAVPAASEAQRERFWALREGLGEAELMAGPSVKHDVAVGVSDVPDFLEAATAAVRALSPALAINAYGHLADGNIHYNVMLGDGAVPADVILRAVHDVIARFDGSIAAEHGIGQSRVSELARLKQGPELDLMRTLKRTLDPEGILNPGKVLAAPRREGESG